MKQDRIITLILLLIILSLIVITLFHSVILPTTSKTMSKVEIMEEYSMPCVYGCIEMFEQINDSSLDRSEQINLCLDECIERMERIKLRD